MPKPERLRQADEKLTVDCRASDRRTRSIGQWNQHIPSRKRNQGGWSQCIMFCNRPWNYRPTGFLPPESRRYILRCFHMWGCAHDRKAARSFQGEISPRTSGLLFTSNTLPDPSRALGPSYISPRTAVSTSPRNGQSGFYDRSPSLERPLNGFSD